MEEIINDGGCGMEREKREEMVIDLMDLWRIFIKRLWIMVLVAVIFMSAFIIYKKVTYVPKYQSTATLYILRSDKEKQNESSYEANSDFALAMNVVNDCDYLLKDKPVLKKVISDLNLKMNYKQLAQCISTNNPEDSRILEVTVRASSPRLAQKIVNKLCKIGAEEIQEAMGFRQVNFYAKGVYDPVPCNQTGLIRYLEVGVIGAVLVYLLFVLLYLLDDGIRSAEDVEKYLGLSVLGEIPNLDLVEGRKDAYIYGRKQNASSVKRLLPGGRRKGM